MNMVTIVPTKFENVPSGGVTLGFRMYDDEAQTYDNTWDEIPDSPVEVLRKVMQSDDACVQAMLEWCVSIKAGLFVDDEVITPAQLAEEYALRNAAEL